MNLQEKINEQVFEVLKNLVSKERHAGAVQGCDKAGTTIFITSGDRRFLAFMDPDKPLMPGEQVTFRIDQFRAVDIQRNSN
jgi:hypothetical protein